MQIAKTKKMKINRKLSLMLFVLILFCMGESYAQSCKRAFWSAQEQYKSGRFESAQNLLDACIKEFNGNKNHYRKNSEMVYKVYELYIAACNKSHNTVCAKAKRKELDAFFR